MAFRYNVCGRNTEFIKHVNDIFKLFSSNSYKCFVVAYLFRVGKII